MKKILLYSTYDYSYIDRLSDILKNKYNYEVIKCISDNILDVMIESGKHWDDILIRIGPSEDNYTYIYYWKDGNEEQKLVNSIKKYTNIVEDPVENNYLIKCTDSIFCDISIGKYAELEDLAKGIYEYLGD